MYFFLGNGVDMGLASWPPWGKEWYNKINSSIY
jgi:hypothetical protein